jgi:hypothetical protein
MQIIHIEFIFCLNSNRLGKLYLNFAGISVCFVIPEEADGV